MVDHSPDDGGDRTSTDRHLPPLEVSDSRSSIDDFLSALSHRRRRDVLYYLAEHDLASVESVAAAIADREAGDEDASAEEREAVRIDLSHNHLPKLTDRRLVEYDRRSGAIRWSASGERLETLLECCRGLEDGDGDVSR